MIRAAGVCVKLSKSIKRSRYFDWKTISTYRYLYLYCNKFDFVKKCTSFLLALAIVTQKSDTCQILLMVIQSTLPAWLSAVSTWNKLTSCLLNFLTGGCTHIPNNIVCVWCTDRRCGQSSWDDWGQSQHSRPASFTSDHGSQGAFNTVPCTHAHVIIWLHPPASMMHELGSCLFFCFH